MKHALRGVQASADTADPAKQPVIRGALNFKALYKDIKSLAETVNLSKTNTLSNYWQYAILAEMILACASAKPDLYKVYADYIPVARTQIKMSERLLSLVQDAWNLIEQFTRPNERDRRAVNLLESQGLDAKTLSNVSDFPIDEGFVENVNKFFHCLDCNEHNIVLILDGFDRLSNDGTASDAVRLIFDSLADAIRSIRAGYDIPKGFEIKAFIPHDRYISLNLRDFDKLDTMHIAIRWSTRSLQEFLKKRLELTPRMQSGTFHALWRQVMPERIHNQHYKLEEDSFQYILRHTMFRPRQLQIHLEHLAEEFQGQIVDPSGIPKCIATSSKQIARHLINEFKSDHPNLHRVLNYLHGSDNVMMYKDFRDLIQRAFYRLGLDAGDESIANSVDNIYSMGLFGIVEFVEPGHVAGDYYCPPTRSDKRHYVDFFYKNPHTNVSLMLGDDSLIAFHPVLLDFANLRPHPEFIVG